MNRIFVLKDVAYAAKQGGGTIADANEVDQLDAGALAFFTPQGTLLTNANAAATIPDLKYVQVAVGRADDQQMLGMVPRVVNDINLANYRAFTKPVITVGAFSFGASDEGDVSVQVADDSYTSRYNVQSLNASVYKRSSDSLSDVMQKLEDKLNVSGSFVVATDPVAAEEIATITVTAAATAAGTATVDLDGVTVNLPLSDTDIATNANEIAATIDALPDWTAVSDGVDEVTVTSVVAESKTDIANYAAGTATTSAATLATTQQGVDSAGTIGITPKEDGVAIRVALSGLAELDPIVNTTAFVHGIGGGADILQMEKDFSVEEGNGNYTEYSAEYYSRTMEASASANYDLITTVWEGQHSSPTRSHNVMKNRLAIACVNAAGNGQAASDVLSIMANIFGNAYDATEGYETATDDGTEHDGVSGN